MLITNDVGLITFVPFAIIVLKLAGEEKLLVWDVRPAPDTFGSRGRRANSDRLMAAWKQQ